MGQIFHRYIISHEQRIHKAFLNVTGKQVNEQSIINANGNRRKISVLAIPTEPSVKVNLIKYYILQIICWEAESDQKLLPVFFSSVLPFTCCHFLFA